MNIKRIVAFGCSHTYGHGLPDCQDGEFLNLPGPKPSKIAWPELVANKLGVACINQSFPGSTNFKIYKSIIDFPFEDGDCAVVMWTNVMRDTLHFKDNTIVDIGPWLLLEPSSKWYSLMKYKYKEIDTIAEKQKLAKNYYSVHSDHDMIIKSEIYIRSALSFLKLYKIPKFFSISTLGNSGYGFNIYSMLDEPVDMADYEVDRAPNDTHYGPETHKIWADIALRRIS